MLDGITPPPAGGPVTSRRDPEIGALLLARPSIAGSIVAAEIAIELSGCVVRGIMLRDYAGAWAFRAEVLPPWLVACPDDWRKIEAEILAVLLVFAPDFFADAVECVRDKCFRQELREEFRIMESAKPRS